MSRRGNDGISVKGEGRSIPGGNLQAIPWKVLGVVFFSHFVVDSHFSFLFPMLPLLREKFEISLTAVGVLIYLLSASTALSQPVAGIMVDRWPRVPWLEFGLLGSSVLFTSVGWMPSYAWVAVALVAGGVLSGLCHPDMASRVGAASEGHRGLSMSVFIAGGRIGFAIGPLMAIAVAELWGMEWLWIYVFLSLAAIVAIRWGMPASVPGSIADHGEKRAENLRLALRRAGKPLALLVGISICRAAVGVNITGFLPTIFVDQGFSLWSGGFANSIMLLSGAVGVIIGGVLSDRYGRRAIILAGVFVSMAGLVGFLASPLWVGMIFLPVLGLGLFLAMGVTVAFAQEFFPGHRGFASSVILGFGWSLASFSVLPISYFAERVGLIQAFWVLPFFLVTSIFLVLRLPKK